MPSPALVGVTSARPNHASRGPVRLLLAVLLTCLLSASLLPSLPAEAAGRTPAVPSGLPRGLETTAGYVPNRSCTPGDRPGTTQLAGLLAKTYRVSTGTARACDGSVTEHSDGRAVDLMLSVRDKSEKADGQALLKWLLATDKAGNRYANARRLGIMYVIWDDKIWASYRAGDGWREYNGCSRNTARSADTACHRDHVHLSLSWEGATAQTSWWSKKVASPRWGACPAAGMNWAPTSGRTRSTPCPRQPTLTAPKSSSAAYRALVPWAGMYLHATATGSPVRAWQQALKVPVTGRWDGATREAVKKLQRGAGLHPSGNANTPSWRAVLKKHAPR